MQIDLLIDECSSHCCRASPVRQTTRYFSTNSLSPFCWACNKERGSIRSKDERINILSPCVSRARRVQQDQNESYHRRQHLIRVINRVPLTRSKCYTTLETFLEIFRRTFFGQFGFADSRVNPRKGGAI